MTKLLFKNYNLPYYFSTFFLIILCALTNPALAVSSPILLARGNSTNITTPITNPTNTTFFDVVPVGLSHTLPWWTSVVGGVVSFFIGVYTISWGWKRQQPEDAVWSLSGPAAFKTITTAFGLFWTFFQSLNGLIHLHQNWGHRDLIRSVGGNAYIGMFAMAAQMWSIKVRGRWMARGVAWIVAGVVIANFALLTLPAIGTAPLYELNSQWCSTVLDSSPQGIGSGAGDCSKYNTITQTPVSFACANSSSLQFHGSHEMPQVVNYVFEGVLGLMFLATLFWQLKKDLDWWNWRRKGGPELPNQWPQQYPNQYPNQYNMQWQQGMQPGYQPQYQEQYHNGYNNQAPKLLPTTVSEVQPNADGRDPLRRDVYFGPKNPHRYVAYVMMAAMYATNFVGVAAYVLSYYAGKSTAVAATLGVCPGIGNSSAPGGFNVTASFGGNGNCTCVDLRLPGVLESVSVSLGASGSNLARLLFNI